MVAAMMWDVLSFLARLFETDVSTLIYQCRTLDPVVIVSMLLSNVTTWFSYMVIGGFFVLFVVKAKVIGWDKGKCGLEIAGLFDIPLTLLTGCFVIVCGNGHLFNFLLMTGKVSELAHSRAHMATAAISAVTAAYLLWRGKRV